MSIRDALESLLRGWDAHERARGLPPIIDFDCHPQGPPATEVPDRIHVYEQLQALREQVAVDESPLVLSRLDADLAYVTALLGERADLDTYLRRTQGLPATGWSADYTEQRRQEAVRALAEVSVDWSAATEADLAASEGALSPAASVEVIRRHAADLEPTVRALVDTDALYVLEVEEVSVDAYWTYWLDGAGNRARLRINANSATFTEIQTRQLALHEILGHALQSASYHQRAEREDVPWVRILSVHAPQQMMLEGLAQALPFFVTPDEPAIMARAKLTHYTQLIRGELHRRINTGTPVAECIAYARSQVPFWSNKRIASLLDDRTNDTQLRSYLWSYPTGIDWFVRLSEQHTDPAQILRACYQDPLTPSDLHSLAALEPDEL